MLVALLAVIGSVSTWQFFFGQPGIAGFRSAEGSDAYTAAYREAFTALPEPTGTRDVRTSFGTVRVYEWSSAETEAATPIVLMPGRSSGVPMWSENLPALAQERPVLAFDPIGDAGMSTQSVPFASMADTAAYVDELLAQVAPDGAHMVAHSLGARTAVELALQHPEDVRSLTLLEPSFTFANPPIEMLWWAAIGTLPLVPEDVRTEALTRVGGGEPYDPEDPMAQMIETGAEHFRAAVPQPSPLTHEQVAALDAPTYVAIGERESLAGGQSAVEGAEPLPDATVEVWPGTTHSLPMQAGDALHEAILDHIDRHD